MAQQLIHSKGETVIPNCIYKCHRMNRDIGVGNQEFSGAVLKYHSISVEEAFCELVIRLHLETRFELILSAGALQGIKASSSRKCCQITLVTNFVYLHNILDVSVK